jgi:hypothetical protein
MSAHQQFVATPIAIRRFRMPAPRIGRPVVLPVLFAVVMVLAW